MRKVFAGLLIAASFAASGAFHNHEDLAGAIQGQPVGGAVDRVVSSHSPFSKASHWHSGVSVKDDTCLACQAHRLAGIAPEACREGLASISQLLRAVVETALSPVAIVSNGSRAPPALL
jgi:hypothetical protein